MIAKSLGINVLSKESVEMGNEGLRTKFGKTPMFLRTKLKIGANKENELFVPDYVWVLVWDNFLSVSLNSFHLWPNILFPQNPYGKFQ